MLTDFFSILLTAKTGEDGCSQAAPRLARFGDECCLQACLEKDLTQRGFGGAV
jgi:hypothetical protein